MHHALNRDTIVSALERSLPGLLAVYAFGSRIQHTAGPDSDLDLAVLVAGYAPPLMLFELAGQLADLSGLAGCAVDLLDLRAASTVMQYQIITTGQRWWASDQQAALFEVAHPEREDSAGHCPRRAAGRHRTQGHRVWPMTC